ncbi:MAG: hypothetical protein ACR2L1_05150 [Pyrinomonadaceae bacterium]
MRSIWLRRNQSGIGERQTRNWLRHIQDIASLYRETLDAICDSNDWLNKLCKPNVIEQVITTAETILISGG